MGLLSITPPMANVGSTYVVDSPTGNATTDHAAITAQISAASAAGGGVVVLRAGTYVVASSVALKDKVSIVGAGKEATTIQGATGLTNAVLLGSSGDTVSDLSIRDLTIDGNRTVFSTNIRGIQVTSGARIIIDNIRIEDVRDIGVYFNATTDSTIRDCVLYQCGKGGTTAHGMNLDPSCHRCMIVNNTIIKNGATGETGFGIRLADSNDCLVQGNYIEQTTAVVTSSNNGSLEPIGWTSSCSRTKCIGNTCLRGGDNGISVSGPFSIVVGNYVEQSCHAGIAVQSTGHHSVINGNTVLNVSQHTGQPHGGIAIDGADSCVVTGNRILDDQGSKTHDYGIKMFSASGERCLAVGNVIEGWITAPYLQTGTLHVFQANQAWTAEPTIAAGTGAGTGPTLSLLVGSDDRRGKVVLTTGTTPTAGGTIVTVTFNGPKTTAPRAVLLTPASPNASQHYTRIYAGTGTTGFSIVNQSTALSAAVLYEWFYEVID